MKLVICRKDLPKNPSWRQEGYPYSSCWEVDSFFEEAAKRGKGSKLYSEARRIFWESYWRSLDRYRGERPFFEAYLMKDRTSTPVRDRKFVLKNILVSAFANDIVPPEAKAYTYRIYRELFGKPTE